MRKLSSYLVIHFRFCFIPHERAYRTYMPNVIIIILPINFHILFEESIQVCVCARACVSVCVCVCVCVCV